VVAANNQANRIMRFIFAGEITRPRRIFKNSRTAKRAIHEFNLEPAFGMAPNTNRPFY
jgi:hypothetical protein